VRTLRSSIRRASVAFAAMLLFGCATPTQRVATAQVARDFYRARYDEVCHIRLTPAWCAGYDVALNETDKTLHEGSAALVYVRESKAAMPLQLKAIDKGIKALKKGYRPDAVTVVAAPTGDVNR
jgi:hypothetical protein